MPRHVDFATVVLRSSKTFLREGGLEKNARIIVKIAGYQRRNEFPYLQSRFDRSRRLHPIRSASSRSSSGTAEGSTTTRARLSSRRNPPTPASPCSRL